MILLKEIKLNNFLSHSKTELEFNSNQKLLIDGKSGSGKSSIVDGLIWALFNKGRADNRSLIKHGADNAKVIVILEDDETNKLYKIERTITSKNKHELKVFEKENTKNKKFVPIKANGTKETQEYLEKDIIHASYILFINSIVYLQESDDDFVRQTAAKRKDIILEIVKASDYDEYLKKAKDKLQEVKTNKEVLSSKIEGEKTFIENNKDVANKLEEYEKEDIRIQKEIEILKAKYKEYTERQKEISNKQNDIKVLEEKLESKKKEYDVNNSTIKELDKKIKELSNVDTKDLENKIKRLNELQKELQKHNDSKEQVMNWNTKYTKILEKKPIERDYDTKIAEINERLIEIIKEKPEECPKCGYIAPNWTEDHQRRLNHQQDTLKSVQSDFDAYLVAVEEYNKELKELGEQPTPLLTPTEYDTLRNNISELEKANEELIKFQTAKDDIEVNKEKIKTISESQKELENEIKMMMTRISEEDFSDEESKIKNNIVKINAEIDGLMMKHSSNKELLGTAKHSKKKIGESEINLDKYKKDLIDINEQIDSLELVKGAFGPNGVKAIIIDYLLPELEGRINDILNKLSDFRIELSTQKSGAGKDVVLEGLFITIINEVGEQFDFANYSGGEKSRISYAIFEALASLSKINFRILDEAFFALDTETATNFIDIVSMLQKNVSTVVCITHLEQIKDLFNDRMSIVKTNGDSRINI